MKRGFAKFRSLSGSRNTRNSVWNTVDLLIAPAAILAASPILIPRMGEHEFGLWMLINSFVGFVGALNFGLGDATIKYAAETHDEQDAADRTDFIQSVAFGFLGIAGLVSVSLLIIDDLLVSEIFDIEESHRSSALFSLHLAALWIGLKIVESGCVALVKGRQRFDAAARVTITENLFVVAAALCLTAFEYGVPEILMFATAAAMMAIFRLWSLARQFFGTPNAYPRLSVRVLTHMMPFGFWAWLQGIAGAVFNQADKFIVGALIGVASLSVYTICLQIGQLIHALFAAGTAFLFPLSSQLLSAGSRDELSRLFVESMSYLVPIVSGLTVLILMSAESILKAVYGAQFAVIGGPLLQMNAVAFGGLALSVIPYYLMNGLGLARLNVIFAVASAILILVLLPPLLRSFDLLGGGMARIANVLVIVPYLVVVKRIVMKDSSWRMIVRFVAGFVVPVGIAVFIQMEAMIQAESLIVNFASAALAAVMLGALSAAIVRQPTVTI